MQFTPWVAVRGRDVARAADTLVSRAGVSCIMQMRSACRRSLGTAREYIVAHCAAHPMGWLCACVAWCEQLTPLVSRAGVTYIYRCGALATVLSARRLINMLWRAVQLTRWLAVRAGVTWREPALTP